MKILYVIFLIAAAIFYPLFRDDLSFILLCTLLIFPVIMLILLIAEVKSVKIRVRDFPEKAVRGEKLRLRVRIKNPLFVPVSCCALTVLYRMDGGSYDKYTVTIPLRAHSTENVDVSIAPKHCGAAECVIKNAVLYDLVGLFSKKVKMNIYMTSAIMPMEYPEAAANTDGASRTDDNSLMQKLSANSSPAEVSGLRDYRDGDRINSIHWKLSSRSEDFIVKEFSEPISGSILVIPDVCSSDEPDARDRIMDIYFSFVKFLIADGIETSVLMNDEDLTVRKAVNLSELESLVTLQVTEHMGSGEMSMTARLTADSERLDPIAGETYSRILIITASEQNAVLSELEQKAFRSGITVLNVGEAGAVSEDKNSDVIIYNIFRDGAIELPSHIAV